MKKFVFCLGADKVSAIYCFNFDFIFAWWFFFCFYTKITLKREVHISQWSTQILWEDNCTSWNKMYNNNKKINTSLEFCSLKNFSNSASSVFSTLLCCVFYFYFIRKTNSIIGNGFYLLNNSLIYFLIKSSYQDRFWAKQKYIYSCHKK